MSYSPICYAYIIGTIDMRTGVCLGFDLFSEEHPTQDLRHMLFTLHKVSAPSYHEAAIKAEEWANADSRLKLRQPERYRPSWVLADAPTSPMLEQEVES
jgi:hypothetical protein